MRLPILDVLRDHRVSEFSQCVGDLGWRKRAVVNKHARSLAFDNLMAVQNGTFGFLD